jgi:hypothetical protein
MPSYRVDRLILAAISIRAARINNPAVRIEPAGFDIMTAGKQLWMRWGEDTFWNAAQSRLAQDGFPFASAPAPSRSATPS